MNLKVGYYSHHVIQVFNKTRDAIVWCTKLMRSDADEHVNVNVTMREKGVGWILRELARDKQAKGAESDAMDINEAKPQVPKTGTLAPGSTVQPKHVIGLEGMAFSQGGHLMSNKKHRLPEGLFKRSKKSYKETHVPTHKSKLTADNEVVPVSALPV
jgi:pre-mRNA-splicing helicase BRR2